MAKTYEPPFAQEKVTGVALLTAAKTTYNDATNAVLLITAGAEGAIVRRVTAIPRATVTASQIQIYRSSDDGTTLTFYSSVLMAAYTMAQTTAAPVTDFAITYAEPWSLAPGERLYAATGVALAGGIIVTAEGENF